MVRRIEMLIQGAILVLALVISSFLGEVSSGQRDAIAAGTGPCDIYASGGTACVAAHSTTRALFGAYSGRLYQVRRASDGATTDIGTLSAGGFANAAAQDSFCAGTTCVITIIYDQTSRGNHLTQAPAGGAAGGPDNLANASALPISAGGHKVYGVFVAPGTGYRNNATNGIATGSGAQGVYMVAAGNHVNSGCCFDYGNAETNSRDNGNGHMGAVYFGTLCWFGFVVPGQCVGSGPWVMADLENGLFAGANGTNTNNTGRNSAFVTGMIKMNSTTYAIKDADANSGGLKTDYNGPLPTTSGYTPLHLEGGIILGIGGDNSKGDAGSFFEGVMTSGMPSDATENAVQSNIVSVGYSTNVGASSLLTNGNIESGTSGWSVFGSGSLSANTSVVHSGANSLLITGRTASWNGPSQDLTSKVTNGKSYTTTVWMRTQSASLTGKVTLALTVNGTTNFLTLAQGAVNSSGWTQLTGTTTVSWSGTLSMARFYAETTSGTDGFFIDDASMQ
ncbi:MAG TPA: arabinofuranosidase catalytic domain-containing protein [Candidatus Dormibacteraeota bacterium]|nr:arabinofuranosidase catalytic domain-containing protein [Candidatus Dormibacteraeota bacterium]